LAQRKEINLTDTNRQIEAVKCDAKLLEPFLIFIALHSTEHLHKVINMKKTPLLFLFAFGTVCADGPRIGIEFESEKDNKTGMINQAVTLLPGWDFSKESLINRVELLVERNKDTKADNSGTTAKENKIFLRLRHNGNISDSFGYYIRGGIGRAFNSEQDFNYAYIEPGVKYIISQNWSWAASYREINSIDNIKGKHVGKFITGPSYDLDKKNGFDLRYVKGNGDKDISAWVFEYVHKY
jgi:hypothetical protein